MEVVPTIFVWSFIHVLEYPNVDDKPKKIPFRAKLDGEHKPAKFLTSYSPNQSVGKYRYLEDPQKNGGALNNGHFR